MLRTDGKTYKIKTTQPYSPEWYAREAVWDRLCNGNYETLAHELECNGYTREYQEAPARYPYIFRKGDETLVLARQLGSATWYSRPL